MRYFSTAGPIIAEAIEEAKEQLIVRRETHLDQLAHKLEEEREYGLGRD